MTDWKLQGNTKHIIRNNWNADRMLRQSAFI